MVMVEEGRRRWRRGRSGGSLCTRRGVGETYQRCYESNELTQRRRLIDAQKRAHLVGLHLEVVQDLRQVLRVLHQHLDTLVVVVFIDRCIHDASLLSLVILAVVASSPLMLPHGQRDLVPVPRQGVQV